jgi:hypothetical protein
VADDGCQCEKIKTVGLLARSRSRSQTHSYMHLHCAPQEGAIKYLLAVLGLEEDVGDEHHDDGRPLQLLPALRAHWPAG